MADSEEEEVGAPGVPVKTSPPKYKRPYCDSTVWIDYLQGPAAAAGEDRAQIAADIFRRAGEDKLVIVASSMVAVEVVHEPTIEDAEVQDLRLFYRRACFQWVAVDLPIAERARDLLKAYGLKHRDAVHLACALAGDADVFLTTDTNDFKLDRYEGLRVAKPYFPFDRQLALQNHVVAGPTGDEDVEGEGEETPPLESADGEERPNASGLSEGDAPA